MKWLNVQKGEDDPVALLARTGGVRQTDSLEVFRCPKPDSDGRYHVHFFIHGLSHVPDHVVARVNELKPGDTLYLMPDPQNAWDPRAVALRTEDPVVMFGYCPRYLVEDVGVLLSDCGPDGVNVVVERLNRDAPLQLRLLASISACWPEDFGPCSGNLYAPLAARFQADPSRATG